MLMKVILFVYIKLVIGYVVYGQTTTEFASSAEIAETNNNEHLNQCLSNYLIPRVVGSSGHSKVQQYTKR
uniref:Uncharacterized protein n=1 Tax=Megaselia scalaris TaxID=36166 RepID=T1GBM8_MEGSC